MIVAYLVNQYPKVSHSFIRREIEGIEAGGVEVARFSIRSVADELVDEKDKQELEKTRFILSVGVLGLLFHVLRAKLTRPWRFWRALVLTWQVGWGSERGILLNLAYLAEACVLLHWLAEANISHIHAHFGTNSTTVAMLCRELGGPSYSFTVHGPEEFDKVYAIGLPEKINRASFVVAVSSFGRSQLWRWCDRSCWSKIHIIHCGVESDFFTNTLMPIPDHKCLVCVGRLGEQKGHLLLVEAVAELVKQGEDLRLVFVGDGPLRKEIEGLINQFGLNDYITITGWATNAEVRQQILGARALVLPSFAEGLPVVIMESLALGRPVISTYVAGIPELVEPGISGWLVPAGSQTDLVGAIWEVLHTSIGQLEAMGKAGAVRVRERHNVAIESGKLVELFKSVSP